MIRPHRRAPQSLGNTAANEGGSLAFRVEHGWNRKHGLKETEAGITMKLKRGAFAATFFLACLAAMELEGVVLEEI
jgi:hypothetical protein